MELIPRFELPCFKAAACRSVQTFGTLETRLTTPSGRTDATWAHAAGHGTD
jgi:hypothetical protein